MRKSGRNTIFYDQLFDLHGLTGDDAVFRLKNFISLHKNITVMINHGKGPFTVRRGDRIAQMVIKEVIRAEIEIKDSLDETVRSAGGFGHTGK